MKPLVPLACLLLTGLPMASGQLWNQNQQSPVEMAAFKKAGVHTCTITVQEFKNDQLVTTYVSDELEYDREGRLIREKWIFDAKGTVYDVITYQYDEQNRVVHEVWEEHPKTEISGNDETYYTYQDGVLKKACVKDPVEQHDDCTEFFYEQGKLVRESSYLDGNFIFEYRDGKVYRHAEGPDGEKNVTVYANDRIVENQHGNLRYFYTYAKNGLLESSYALRDGKKINENTFTYTKNLPLVSILMNLEEKVKKVETYSYTYY